MNNPRISIIIPAFNEEKYIGKTLESVKYAMQIYGNTDEVEIIVVNNNSSDRTEGIAKQYGATVVFAKERCIATVRNKGAKAAKGGIIGFLDADSLITPNMFNSINDTMSSGKYIGGGTDIKFNRSSLGLFCTLCVTVFPFRWLLGIAGGLLFTRKETFEELGGFDESLYCAEDAKLALELKSYGKQKGKKFKIITSDYIVTSTRTFDQFGDWYYFKNIPKILFVKKAFKNKNFCRKFWYDIER